jgi:hypothetical protein
MENPLPPNAEAYLKAFARELWPLASDERDSILLELRGHLIDRAAAGALDPTLGALGSPKSLAQSFDYTGPREAWASLPGSFGHDRRRKSIAEVLHEARATMRACRTGLLFVGALLVTGLTSTTYLSWIAVRLPWVGVNFVGVLAVRLVIVLAALNAAYRLALSRTAPPWSIDRAMMAFGASMVGAAAFAMGGAAVVIIGVRKALFAFGATHAWAVSVNLLVTLLALAAASILLLRVQPWLAGLAAMRPLSLAASWRGMSGRMGNVVKGWFAIVLPFYLVHFSCDVLALRLLPFGPASLLLAGLDAVATTGLVIGAVMLNATAYRWVVGEPIPAPSHFSTEAPSAEYVEAARARLRLLIGPTSEPSL